MATKVMMSTEGVEVSRVESAPVFEVKDDKRGVIGDLTVSTGGVRWRSKFGREPVMLPWDEFDELMKAQAAKK
ncbi:MAG: hypothetical protein IV086_05330 [Hyphomonadaceae bacterium]|nr:MAG: hypothetical protein FD160_87 [Caulobacteraceae bacterium]MBT9445100.1 hypothetical protein [Hyphomonadaceae bacterium]TPW08423.1 MAG: hypothetical protein FD124_387 [Alphaproteobacteria bacterium]